MDVPSVGKSGPTCSSIKYELEGTTKSAVSPCYWLRTLTKMYMYAAIWVSTNIGMGHIIVCIVHDTALRLTPSATTARFDLSSVRPATVVLFSLST